MAYEYTTKLGMCGDPNAAQIDAQTQADAGGSQPPPAQNNQATPFYQQWWFWLSMAGVASVAFAGVVYTQHEKVEQY
jgi:hypothetical protein